MKLFKILLIVFSIIVVQSNLFGQTNLYEDTGTLSPADSTSAEIVTADSLSEKTVTKDTTIIQLPYYRTISIGMCGDINKPDTDEGSYSEDYFKISAMFHDKNALIYPSFIEVDYIFGIGEFNDAIFSNLIFGKSFGGSFNDKGACFILDVGTGMSYFWRTYSEQESTDHIGISGIYRCGIGYNGFVFHFETNLILTRNYTFEILSLNLSYTF